MLLGLTGGIASGKSTVVDIFKKNGIPTVDTDSIAREIVEPGEKAWVKIVEYFGQAILLPDKTINRKKLGDIVFRSQIKRKKLEKITHPIIIEETMKRAKKLEEKFNMVVVDVPLLFEANMEASFDLIIVVYVDKITQLRRLIDRDNISKEEALLRIETQIDIEIKKEKADIIINNNLKIEETEKQVKNLIYNKFNIV